MSFTTDVKTLERVDDLMTRYRKGIITIEELVVTFAAINNVHTTTIHDTHIEALAALKRMGGLLEEALGQEYVDALEMLHARLVLAQENKLVLSGRMRVIKMQQPDEKEKHSHEGYY